MDPMERDECLALIASGDIKLPTYRAAYTAVTNVVCTWTDDQLIEYIRHEEDDWDQQERGELMVKFEANSFKVENAEAETVE